MLDIGQSAVRSLVPFGRIIGKEKAIQKGPAVPGCCWGLAGLLKGVDIRMATVIPNCNLLCRTFVVPLYSVETLREWVGNNLGGFN